MALGSRRGARLSKNNFRSLVNFQQSKWFWHCSTDPSGSLSVLCQHVALYVVEGGLHYLGCRSAIQSEVGRYAPKRMQPERRLILLVL